MGFVHGCLQLRMARDGSSADLGESLDALEVSNADNAQHTSVDNVPSKTPYKRKCRLNRGQRL
jgi:hypothetical protein